MVVESCRIKCDNIDHGGTIVQTPKSGTDITLSELNPTFVFANDTNAIPIGSQI